MPRRARLDVPGTLHHVMVRGIERRRIVNDVGGRKNFVERLGEFAAGTGNRLTQSSTPFASPITSTRYGIPLRSLKRLKSVLHIQLRHNFPEIVMGFFDEVERQG